MKKIFLSLALIIGISLKSQVITTQARFGPHTNQQSSILTINITNDVANISHSVISANANDAYQLSVENPIITVLPNNTISAPVGTKIWLIPHDPNLQPVGIIAGGSGSGGGSGGGGGGAEFKCKCSTPGSTSGCSILIVDANGKTTMKCSNDSCGNCCEGYVEIPEISNNIGSYTAIVATSIVWNGNTYSL